MLVNEVGPQLVQIVKDVHARWVVHRDIKPSNIVRCLETQRIILIDFGAATHDQEQPQLAHTPDFASERVIKGFPGTFDDDWISVGYTSMAIIRGNSDDRPSLEAIKEQFPYLSAYLPASSKQDEI